jgi:hypothetical protein
MQCQNQRISILLSEILGDLGRNLIQVLKLMDWSTKILLAINALMAAAILWQACETRKLARLNEKLLKDNHRLAERPSIIELIGQGLFPLIDAMHNIKDKWRGLCGSPPSYLILDDLTISTYVKSKFMVNQSICDDLKIKEPTLCGMIAKYDNQVKQFWGLLSNKSNGKSKKQIQLSDLPNSGIEFIRERAPSLLTEIAKIEGESGRVRDKYRKEYNIPMGVLEDSMKKTGIRSSREL